MHSVHAFIVHFPIALLIVAWMLDAAGILRNRPELLRLAWLNQLAGTAGALAAVASGLWTKSTLQPGGDAAGFAEIHEQLAFLSAALFGALFYWRLRGGGTIRAGERRAYLILFTVGVIILALTGYAGGEIAARR